MSTASTYGASVFPYSGTFPQAKELTQVGIGRGVGMFVDAARRTIRVGLDVIEIHDAPCVIGPDEYGGRESYPLAHRCHRRYPRSHSVYYAARFSAGICNVFYSDVSSS